MSNIPDCYQFIKIKAANTSTNTNEKTLVKLFCVWTGGYGRGDSWKLNSGVKNITIRSVSIDPCSTDESVLDIHGYSGSIYTIMNKECTQLSNYAEDVLYRILDRAKMDGVDCELISVKDVLEMFNVQY